MLVGDAVMEFQALCGGECPVIFGDFVEDLEYVSQTQRRSSCSCWAPAEAARRLL